MRLYVTGSVAFDRIMTFPGKFADHILPEKIHILNVCFMVERLEEKFGGTAGNIAYTLKLLGEEPQIVACAGRDFGAYRDWLDEKGISRELIREEPAEFTACAYITTDASDNQITGFNPGAMRIQAAWEPEGKPKGFMHVAPGNLDDMALYAAKGKALGWPVLVDPGQAIPALGGERLRQMIDGADYLFTNDYELTLVSQSTGLTEAEIAAKVKTLVTTLGEKGCRITHGDETTDIAAVPAREVKDPTGAGDSFRAGFLHGLRLGKTHATCARLGATAAAYVVEHYGTQEHRFTMKEFTARFTAAYGPMGD